MRLILVTAEPGDAVDGEKYEGNRATWIATNADIFVKAMSDDSLRRNGRRTPFHRNLTKILNLCLPEMDLSEQLRLTWFTNTVKCAAEKSGGPVPPTVAATCVAEYLKLEIEVLPKEAFVIALGGKARHRMERHGVRVDAVACHPSARNRVKAVQSWERAAEAFRRAKSSL